MIAMSIRAARTRRLSSLDPETGTAGGPAPTFTTPQKAILGGPPLTPGGGPGTGGTRYPANERGAPGARGGPLGQRSDMIRRNGARRRGRPGLELVASGGLRLRAGHPLVESGGRDPGGRADRRRDGRGAHPAPRADRPGPAHRGRVRVVL